MSHNIENAITVMMEINETEATLLLRILQDGNLAMTGAAVNGDDVDTLLLIEERLGEAIELLTQQRERIEASLAAREAKVVRCGDLDLPHVWVKDETGLDICSICGEQRA